MVRLFAKLNEITMPKLQRQFYTGLDGLMTIEYGLLTFMCLPSHTNNHLHSLCTPPPSNAFYSPLPTTTCHFPKSSTYSQLDHLLLVVKSPRDILITSSHFPTFEVNSLDA
ncbi:hypothetical protein EGR_08617 [Echinococcus granulosus]|uniref:Uncharacterized protein n=1 Tax=Echinococcus granulosus TaxID=6210 RepID=W6UT37_ECHGR|nr:hypothetical protein EGR_08617 [Echinococcus granulosus]EUB56544.1 hypothetical protein EGR_08617 [Echinococcus granulosus]